MLNIHRQAYQSDLKEQEWKWLKRFLPQPSTVGSKWRLSGLWAKINRLLREQVRQAAGREATPSAAIVDAQSVKTTLVKGVRGFDAAT